MVAAVAKEEPAPVRQVPTSPPLREVLELPAAAHRLEAMLQLLEAKAAKEEPPAPPPQVQAQTKLLTQAQAVAVEEAQRGILSGCLFNPHPKKAEMEVLAPSPPPPLPPPPPVAAEVEVLVGFNQSTALVVQVEVMLAALAVPRVLPKMKEAHQAGCSI